MGGGCPSPSEFPGASELGKFPSSTQLRDPSAGDSACAAGPTPARTTPGPPPQAPGCPLRTKSQGPQPQLGLGLGLQGPISTQDPGPLAPSRVPRLPHFSLRCPRQAVQSRISPWCHYSHPSTLFTSPPSHSRGRRAVPLSCPKLPTYSSTFFLQADPALGHYPSHASSSSTPNMAGVTTFLVRTPCPGPQHLGSSSCHS